MTKKTTTWLSVLLALCLMLSGLAMAEEAPQAAEADALLTEPVDAIVDEVEVDLLSGAADEASDDPEDAEYDLMAVLSEEDAPEREEWESSSDESVEVAVDNLDLMDLDDEALLQGYMDRCAAKGVGGPEALVRPGRDNLVEEGLMLSVRMYDLLESKIKAVAQGKITNTAFVFTDKELGLSNSWWTAEELGRESLYGSGNTAALMQKEGLNLLKLKWAMWEDYAYDLFWFDRAEMSAFTSDVTYKEKNGKRTHARLTNLTYSMPVALDYAVDTYKINKLPKRVTNAAANVRKIVAKYKNLNDYDKLRAYADTVCSMVEYGKGSEASDKNPYTAQESLIPVFDGDDNTRVVCSGYAKAFKYLCDMSDFKGDIRCILMKGRVVGYDHGPSHEWNVVSMPDGRRYIVDTSGGDAGDYCNDALFMKACYGEPGYPYVCHSRLYILSDERAAGVFSEGSPWLDLSRGDYGKDYDVFVSAKNGTMTATPSTADPGTVVTLKLKPASDCKNAKPVVKRGSGNVSLKKVNSTTYTFTMPSGVVYAQVEFTPKSRNWNAINGIGALRGGTVTAKVGGKEVAGAAKGKTVTLVAAPVKGYLVKAPTLTRAGKKVSLKKVNATTWTFTMPDGEVELSDPFKVDTSWQALQKKINRAKSGATIKLKSDITAGAGNVGLIVPVGKNITIDLAGHTLDRGLTSASPNGYVIQVLGKLTIKDSSAKKTGKIIGGYNAEHGGAIMVSQNARLTLKGGSLIGNKSAECGGGVYVVRGTFVMSGGAIMDSVGTLYGGGVFMDVADFHMSGGTISGNTALGDSHGGGVFVENGSFKFTGGTISGNRAQIGGGAYLDKSGFLMSEGSVKDNIADSYGGGLAVYYKDFTISGGTISGNQSNGSGGGISAIHGNVTFIGGTVSGNNAKGDSYGGGMYVSDGSLTMTGGTVSGNSANSGGGIYARQSEFKLSKGKIKNNTSATVGGGVTVYGKDFLMSGGAITDNRSGSNGGGVSLNKGLFGLSGGTIGNNTSSEAGGGVYVSDGTFEITGATISDNKAATGGGVFVRGTTFTMKNGGIKNNSVTGEGGGVFVSAQDFKVTGGEISGNTSQGNGGGINVTKGKLELSNATVSGNTVAGKNLGGGLFVSSGSLTLNNATVSENKAGGGGGVYVRQSAFTATDCKFNNNESRDVGGGVSAYGKDFTMNGGEISGNTSASNGGGVSINQGTLELFGVTVDGNTCDDRSSGGGVYVSNGGLTLKNATVSNNKAGSGGGVYVRASDFDMDGCKITGNTVVGAGGGLFLNGIACTMASGEITGNTSGGNGGGINVLKAGFTFTGGLISGNTCKGESLGGGVYVSDGGFTMNGDATLSNNTAGGGGGAYVRQGAFNLSQGTVKDNIAKGTGGGVAVYNRNCTMTSGEISGNTSGDNGGGLWLQSGSLTFSGGTISGNTSDAKGGGVFISNGNYTMSDGSVNGNSAQMGGGVYVRQGVLTMTGGGITQNDSQDVGGGLIFTGCPLKISGAVVIDGNHSQVNGFTEPHNVYMSKSDIITIDGALSADAKIGVTGKCHVFTKGLGGNGNLDAFFSDNDGFAVVRSGDGQEAELVFN